jgi:hypothetical protein
MTFNTLACTSSPRVQNSWTVAVNTRSTRANSRTVSIRPCFAPTVTFLRSMGVAEPLRSICFGWHGWTRASYPPPVVTSPCQPAMPGGPRVRCVCRPERDKLTLVVFPGGETARR